MKMFKLTYEYLYFSDPVKATLGYFDSEEKALESWEKNFSREKLKKKDGEDAMFSHGSLDDKKREYSFSCCGWRETYRVEDHKPYKNNEPFSQGGEPSKLNTVDMSIKHAVKTLADKISDLKRSSLNYGKMR